MAKFYPVLKKLSLAGFSFFAVTFAVYYFNLDMKLTAAMEPVLEYFYDKVDRDQHLQYKIKIAMTEASVMAIFLRFTMRRSVRYHGGSASTARRHPMRPRSLLSARGESSPCRAAFCLSTPRICRRRRN